MITDGKKWHYLAARKLSGFLGGTKAKHNGHFSCLNYFYLYRTENKIKKHYNICKNDNYYYVEMPKEDSEISKYNYGENSMKLPFIIYAAMESLLEKVNICHNNSKRSSTTVINKHTSSGCSLFTHFLFDAIKNKFDC